MHHVSDAATAATVPNGTQEPYEVNQQGIFHTYRSGERRRLSNFSARITSVVQDESGLAVAYGLTATLGDEETAFRVPVVCSPKTEPGVMRVLSGREAGKDCHETQTSNARAGHRPAA